MTVHVLIPVFNRLAMTREVLGHLRAQLADEPIRIVIIDDGSTDGTGEFLAAQPDVHVLHGDGSLWWGGAIHLGLQYLEKVATADDWVLFVNNDTTFGSRFVQNLLDPARKYAPAAIGSVVRDEDSPELLLSIGPMLDTTRLRVIDKLLVPGQKPTSPDGVHDVDALSGRGVLYPMKAFSSAGLMRPRWLPHYLADYELSVRVRASGFRLLVADEAAVLSSREFGNTHKSVSFWDSMTSVRSPNYVPAVFLFWWGASSVWRKALLVPRLILIRLWAVVRARMHGRHHRTVS